MISTKGCIEFWIYLNPTIGLVFEIIAFLGTSFFHLWTEQHLADAVHSLNSKPNNRHVQLHSWGLSAQLFWCCKQCWRLFAVCSEHYGLWLMRCDTITMFLLHERLREEIWSSVCAAPGFKPKGWEKTRSISLTLIFSTDLLIPATFWKWTWTSNFQDFWFYSFSHFGF